MEDFSTFSQNTYKLIYIVHTLNMTRRELPSQKLRYNIHTKTSVFAHHKMKHEKIGEERLNHEMLEFGI